MTCIHSRTTLCTLKTNEKPAYKPNAKFKNNFGLQCKPKNKTQTIHFLNINKIIPQLPKPSCLCTLQKTCILFFFPYFGRNQNPLCGFIIKNIALYKIICSITIYFPLLTRKKNDLLAHSTRKPSGCCSSFCSLHKSLSFLSFNNCCHF